MQKTFLAIPVSGGKKLVVRARNLHQVRHRLPHHGEDYIIEEKQGCYRYRPLYITALEVGNNIGSTLTKG